MSKFILFSKQASKKERKRLEENPSNEALTTYLINKSYYGGKRLKRNVIPNLQKKLIGQGLFSRVYKINGTKWIVKEGKWDLDINIFFTSFKISWKDIELGMRKTFGYSFLPYKDEVKRQYKDYIVFSEYLGYFEETGYNHKKIKDIISDQKNLRENLEKRILKEEKKTRYTINKSIYKLLEEDEVRYYNFLPNEFTIYGRTKRMDKNTFFIFQEFIEGKPFSNVSDKELDIKSKKQFALFMLLIILLYFEKGIVPDLRPSPKNIHKWMYKTENMMVSNNGDLKFIDTRWVWNVNDNLVKRGFIIPNLVLSQAHENLNRLLKDIYDE